VFAATRSTCGGAVVAVCAVGVGFFDFTYMKPAAATPAPAMRTRNTATSTIAPERRGGGIDAACAYGGTTTPPPLPGCAYGDIGIGFGVACIGFGVTY